ncbi:MAG: BON domain-containing protein [Candidatus Hydrogenedentes bacterium]|nr:BON domain-containing protein [Candidatus Hydrogenedentota bacterium]
MYRSAFEITMAVILGACWSFAEPTGGIAQPVAETTPAAPAGTGAPVEQHKESIADQVRDAALTARIETTYLLNKYLSPFSINTTTKNRHVTLEGTVEDKIEKELAERLARSVEGVEVVTNNLKIVPADQARPDQETAKEGTPATGLRRMARPWTVKVDDETLRADVRSRLAYNTTVKNADIDVEVDGGSVELTGKVASEEDKQEVERLVRDVDGVKHVDNALSVDTVLAARTEETTEETEEAEREAAEQRAETAEERDEIVDIAPEDPTEETAGEKVAQKSENVIDTLSDEWIEKRVEANLALNRYISMGDLDVEVDNGVCTITGTVLADQQRNTIGNIAQTTPGVKQVMNNVTVTKWQQSRNPLED